MDVRRNMPFQRNRKYLRERVSESLGLLYATHFPYRQFETARGARRSPLYDRLRAAGACHGETAGWERPNWYAPAGVEAKYEYSYGRQNWFAHAAAEHRAVRERVGLFDQSLVRQVSPGGPGCGARAEPGLHQQHRCTSGAYRLYPVAKRARRHSKPT